MPLYRTPGDIPSRFGEFGGRYIPETLMVAHEQLEEIYVAASQDPEFQIELEALGKNFIGRPSSSMCPFSHLLVFQCAVLGLTRCVPFLRFGFIKRPCTFAKT